MSEIKKKALGKCHIKGCRRNAVDISKHFPMPLCKKHLDETDKMFEDTYNYMKDPKNNTKIKM